MRRPPQHLPYRIRRSPADRERLAQEMDRRREIPQEDVDMEGVNCAFEDEPSAINSPSPSSPDMVQDFVDENRAIPHRKHSQCWTNRVEDEEKFENEKDERIERLQEKVADQKDIITDRDEELAALKEDNERLEQSAAASKSELADRNNELVDAKKELADTKKELDELRKLLALTAIGPSVPNTQPGEVYVNDTDMNEASDGEEESVEVCLRYLRGRCTMPRCKFLHPSNASGSVA